MSYNKYPGYVRVYEGAGGFLFIMDLSTKAAIILHHTQMKGFIENLAKCKAIMEYEPKPTTVDGMTALKHIMDGGGAYRVSEVEIGRSPAIRLSKRGDGTYFNREGHEPGAVTGLLLTANDLLATDWVLVP